MASANEPEELVKLRKQAAKQKNSESYLYVCEYYVKNGGDKERLNAYLDSAYNAAVKEKSDTWLGQYYTIKANMYKGGGPESEMIYRDMKKRSLFHFRKGNIDFILPHLNAEIGLSFFNTNSYDSAIYYFHKGLAISPPKKDNPAFPIDKAHKNILHFMAHSYKMKHQNDSALFYGRKMEELCLKIKDSVSLVEIRYTMAVTYNDMKKYPENLEYYVKAAQTAEAIKKYNYAITSYRAAASVQEQQKKYKEALDLAGQSLKYARLINDKREMASCMSTIALIHVGMGESRKAIDIYRESLIYYKQGGDKLSYQLTYTVMVDLFTTLGMQDSAWVYMGNLEKMGDLGEIADTNLYMNAIQELKAKQIAADLAILGKEAEQNSINHQYLEQKVEALQQRNLIIIVMSCLLVILLLTLYVKQHLKIKDTKLNYYKKSKESEYRFLQKITEIGVIRNYIAEVENERKSVAKQLDVKIKQIMSVLDVEPDAVIKPENIEKVKDVLAEIQDGINSFTKESKSFSFRYIDLDSMLTVYSSYLNKPDSFVLNYTSKNDESWDKIPRTIASELFRIVQEALNNCIKHASAQRVDVSLVLENKKVQLSIQDNGKGFNTEKKTNGTGLRTIAERAKDLDAELYIDSALDKGTEIKISFMLS